MGTRSLTIVRDGNTKQDECLVMYRQMDGYPDGHGKDLFDAFGHFQLCNGISFGDNSNKANGLSCLAAQIVAEFKDGIGEFYLYPSGTRDTGEEYIYIISEDEDHILTLEVQEAGWGSKKGKVLYSGRFSDFGKWLEDQRQDND